MTAVGGAPGRAPLRANAAARDAIELERTNPRFARCRRQDAKALRGLARMVLAS